MHEKRVCFFLHNVLNSDTVSYYRIAFLRQSCTNERISHFGLTAPCVYYIPFQKNQNVGKFVNRCFLEKRMDHHPSKNATFSRHGCSLERISQPTLKLAWKKKCFLSIEWCQEWLGFPVCLAVFLLLFFATHQTVTAIRPFAALPDRIHGKVSFFLMPQQIWIVSHYICNLKVRCSSRSRGYSKTLQKEWTLETDRFGKQKVEASYFKLRVLAEFEMTWSMPYHTLFLVFSFPAFLSSCLFTCFSKHLLY